ncbi:hypothetical protein [Pedobacter sp. BMA]|uniref:hypothetical protein n=1 Tax=Pedobacter sp. BMA TaxID=1663685 RepID=UPI000649A964|nr:hypothetical protein [Pedobacter sp. BMA]KLT65384.1 hypothetical protein AB669_09840 [Pedobacter sp. BMA]
MNIEMLKQTLDVLNINFKDYSLDGISLPMQTVLSRSGDTWVTFEYDEVGRSLDLKEFINEEDACKDILERLCYLVEWRKKYNVR